MENSNNTLQLVEFSHHDLGWHKLGFKEESDFTEYEINLALDIMNKDEEHKFCWTQEYALYIYQYLMKHGNRYDELKKRILEGRFEIGTGYTSPYTAFITAELLARQMLYGKKWVEKIFPGYHATVYYNTDVPSLTMQFPQILVKSGTEYLYLSRSWNFDNFKQNEFLKWKSPDGTEIKTHFMHHYGDNVWEEKTVPFVEKRVPDYNYNFPILLIAMDCTPPNDLSKLLDDWEAYRNAEENAEKKLPSLRYNTYQKAIEVIFENNEFPFSLEGEWPNKWIYENDGSDYNCFLKQKEAQNKLSMAEMLGVIYAVSKHSFKEYEAGEFEQAWRYAERACHGYAPEKPIEAFREAYKKADDIAKSLLSKYAEKIAEGITLKGKGIPVCIFHMGAKEVEQIIQISVPEELKNARKIKASLADGTICDTQYDSNENIWIKLPLPAAGFLTVYLERVEAELLIEPVIESTNTLYENAYYCMELDGNGIKKIWDRENQKELFVNGKFYAGEAVIMDYDGMGAGEHLNLWQPDPQKVKYLCREQPLKWKLVNKGRVCSVYEAVLIVKEAEIKYRITAYHNVKKIDFDVNIKNLQIEDRKQIRLMFPVNDGQVAYEVPFGEIKVGQDEVLKKFSRFNPNRGNHNDTNHDDNTGVRPREVQNYISCMDADGFETMITGYNVPWDYQDPTENPLAEPVLQPVLLSTSKACHWLYGCWSQHDDRSYHFTITSGKDCHDSLCAKAMEENTGIWYCKATGNGSLFAEDCYNFLELDSDKIQITAIKKAEDSQLGYVIRMYNRAQENAAASCRFYEKMEAYSKIDMIERPLEKMHAFEREEILEINLGKMEIANYYLMPQGMKLSDTAPEGVMASVERKENETLHTVTISWFEEESRNGFKVYIKNAAEKTWEKVIETKQNQVRVMLPDGNYEAAVQKDGSVLSCPIEVFIENS